MKIAKCPAIKIYDHISIFYNIISCNEMFYHGIKHYIGVRIIRTCVCHLERLDPDIVPAALCMAKDQLDKMAVRHVKLLMKEWSFELNTLIQVLDEMTDPQIFLGVSGKYFTLKYK
jgi:hypothetical protein